MSNDIPVECTSCQAAINEFFGYESMSTHPFSQFRESMRVRLCIYFRPTTPVAEKVAFAIDV